MSKNDVDVTILGDLTEGYMYYPSKVITESYLRHPVAERVTIRKPDGRRPKPTGWLYPTPYSFSKELVIKHPGEHRWVDYPYYTTVIFSGIAPVGCESTELPYHTEDPQPLIDRAVTKALLKLKKQRINIATNLAEAQQTANLIGTTATRIGRSYRALRHGRWRQAINLLGQSARGRQQPKNWLELQYGWKPLLSDVYGAWETFKDHGRLDEYNDWVTGVSGYAAEKHDLLQVFGTDTDFPRQRSGEHKFSAKVDLFYIPKTEILALATQVGLTNPLEVLWEETPYSFVVDWFLPVGNYLSTLDATLDWDFLSGSVSVRHKSQGSFKYLPKTGPSVAGGASSTMGAVWWKKDLTRSVFSSSPLPHSPRLKNPLNLMHMANGLSLLAEAFGRR